MSRRTYNQACGLAVALDLLGERWTLLILRELLHGPKRFKDLVDGLPGIGTGLLAERLRQLEATGVIEHTTLPPPAGSAVYALAPDGEELRPVILGLARWGASRTDDLAAAGIPTPDSIMVGLEASFAPEAARGADGVYEMRIDGTPFRIEIQKQQITVRAGGAESPRATVITDPTTLLRLRSGEVTVEHALTDGTLTVEGDAGRALHLAAAFGLQSPTAVG